MTSREICLKQFFYFFFIPLSQLDFYATNVRLNQFRPKLANIEYTSTAKGKDMHYDFSYNSLTTTTSI